MALVSLAKFPSPPIPCTSITHVRFSPPSVALFHHAHQTHYTLRPLHFTNRAGLTSRIGCCQRRVRASVHSGNNPSHPPDDEEEGPFQEEGDLNGLDDSVGSPPDPLASSFSPTLQPGVLNQQQHEQLQQTLETVSQSLTLLSATLSEISSAVRLLSETLRSPQSQSSSSSSTSSLSPSSPLSSPPSIGSLSPNARDLEADSEAEAISRGPWSPVPSDSPWDDKTIPAKEGEEIEKSIISDEDKMPPHLVEQNKRAHELAYKLQQSFVQARIEGLGQPFPVAVDDFISTCMAAHDLGIGLKELQLQVVLQDGSLRGAFAIRNQRWSGDPILTEESRIRSLWIRLAYTTLAQMGPDESVDGEVDPIDSFVKQVVQSAFEKGFDLERAKLEQTFTDSDVNSRAVKTMKENQYLILLTLEKAKSRNK